MKYVRTKNAILKKNDNGVIDMGKPENWGEDLTQVRQADTIEELIDTYVIVNEGGVPYTERKIWDIILSECDEVYGAISTNKGLIYVAKINEEGELELL